MKTLLSVFGIVLLTLALGGCYVSKQPLFDRKDAVYPFADGTRYIEYTQSGGAWNEYARGTLTINNGWYVATNKGQEKDAVKFLMRPWGKNYLGVATGANAKAGENHLYNYLYGILRPQSGEFLEYGPECRTLGVDALRKKGLVTVSLDHAEDCVPVSLAALGTIMQMVLDSQAKPNAKYVIVQ